MLIPAVRVPALRHAAGVAEEAYSPLEIATSRSVYREGHMDAARQGTYQLHARCAHPSSAARPRCAASSWPAMSALAPAELSAHRCDTIQDQLK